MVDGDGCSNGCSNGCGYFHGSGYGHGSGMTDIMLNIKMKSIQTYNTIVIW
jgi:hypothetical protein